MGPLRKWKCPLNPPTSDRIAHRGPVPVPGLEGPRVVPLAPSQNCNSGRKGSPGPLPREPQLQRTFPASDP